MKNNCFLLLSLLVIFISASATASAQKRMQITLVNDSAEAVIGLNLMQGSLVTGDYRKLKQLSLSSPLKPNGRSTMTFDVEVMTPVVVQGVNFYARKYAVEVLWAGGCKKILDLRYESPTQTVSAGAKQCGLYKFEVRQMAEYKRDADRYLSQKDYSLAEEYYSRIISLDPRNEYAIHRRGHAYAALKKHIEAANDFTAAIALSAEPAHLYSDRGNAYYAAGNYERAGADFGRAFELAPKNTLHLKNRWAAMCRAGKIELANSDQKKLVELGETVPSSCTEWRRQFTQKS